jgi:hypothetical protein
LISLLPGAAGAPAAVQAGTANTGGGGGGAVGGNGGAGGSGIVIVKELNKASGVWNIKSAFSAVKSGTWPQTQCSVSLDYLVVAGGGAARDGGGGAGESNAVKAHGDA